MTIRNHAEQKFSVVFAILLVFYCRGRRPRRSAYRCFGFNIICIFYTMFGVKIYNIVCFFSFVTNPSLAASMSGCRGRQPLHICVYSLSAAKSLSLFADFTLYKKLQKRCRDLFSDTALYFALVCIIIFSFSFDPCCVDISQVFQILFL
mgnify:CR=1 FL=1